MNPVRLFLGALLVLVIVITSLLAGYHRTVAVQRGYRGLAMVEMFGTKALDAEASPLNKLPKPLGPAKTDGPRAGETYQNVQVLGDLSKPQFARVMLSIKNWVAPDVGCNYCHAAPVYNSDEKYTKRVAREMLKMTRHINTDWKKHVGATGVTCYTCHRGQNVPPRLWFSAPARLSTGNSWQKSPQRLPTAAASATALPNDALTDYLLHDNPIRVVGPTALQTGNRNAVWHARDTYGLMMVFSESLGVNCTYCHNTKAPAEWKLSTPQRVTAWYGIRMVRDLNNNIELPLLGTLPPGRLGPTGDTPKIYCGTCHQGAFKPLYGAPMIKFYPELVRPADAPNPFADDPYLPKEEAPPDVAPAAAPMPAPAAPMAPAATKTAQTPAQAPPAPIGGE